MKTLMICCLWLGWAVEVSAVPPATFEEYKKLPESEREALIANQQHPRWAKFALWRWRLQIGESSWEQIALSKVADARGFGGLDGLFGHYQTLKEEYLLEARRKVPPNSSAAETARWQKDYASAGERYVDALRLYSTLVSTPETQALNQRAQDISVAWTKQFPPGTNYVISQQQMAEIERQAQQIIDQLKALPKITPAETQAAIDQLPDRIN